MTENAIYAKHHILPKALYPEYVSFKDFPWNEVLLTFKEHKLAHILLAKTFYKTNMHSALRFFGIDMVSGTNWYNDGTNNIRVLSKDSEGLIKGRTSTEAWKNKTYVSKNGVNKQIDISELEFYLSEGYTKYMIKKTLIFFTNDIVNVAMTKEYVEKFKIQNPEYRLGYIVKSERRKIGSSKIYHKNDIECRVMEHEVDSFEENGWIKGRSNKTKDSCAKYQINKDGIGKRVSEEELNTKLLEGWTLGLPKGTKYNTYFLGKVIINNGIKSQYVKSEELIHYLDNGWIKGRLPKSLTPSML